MEQLNNLYFVQLKKIAKELKIKGRSRMCKEDFINVFKKFTEEEIINLIQKVNPYNNYICIHGKCKYYCKECDGSYICEHNKNKYQCRECKGP